MIYVEKTGQRYLQCFFRAVESSQGERYGIMPEEHAAIWRNAKE